MTPKVLLVVFALSSLLLYGFNEYYYYWSNLTVEALQARTNVEVQKSRSLPNMFFVAGCFVTWGAWLNLFIKVLSIGDSERMEWHPSLKNSFIMETTSLIKAEVRRLIRSITQKKGHKAEP